MDFLSWFLAGLAVYRVAHMIAREEGPFSAFNRLRDRFDQSTWYGRGLHCPMCISFWLGFLAAAPVAASVYSWIIGALAISALTVLLTKLIN